jgi:hypothetical protein
MFKSLKCFTGERISIKIIRKLNCVHTLLLKVQTIILGVSVKALDRHLRAHPPSP